MFKLIHNSIVYFADTLNDITVIIENPINRSELIDINRKQVFTYAGVDLVIYSELLINGADHVAGS
ncbi:MAG: hypothetical protein ACTSR2_08340 [Candidatus Hodarchaeales archaeon]